MKEYGFSYIISLKISTTTKNIQFYEEVCVVNGLLYAVFRTYIVTDFYLITFDTIT